LLLARLSGGPPGTPGAEAPTADEEQGRTGEALGDQRPVPGTRDGRGDRNRKRQKLRGGFERRDRREPHLEAQQRPVLRRHAAEEEAERQPARDAAERRLRIEIRDQRRCQHQGERNSSTHHRVDPEERRHVPMGNVGLLNGRGREPQLLEEIQHRAERRHHGDEAEGVGRQKTR
jgi:hypothetical protein